VKFAVLLWVTSLAAAAEYPVTHRHIRGDEPGRLIVEDGGIRYTEAKLHKKPHDYKWGWNDIQKLELEPDRIEITTYKDVPWLGGRDRRFTFFGTNLESTYPILRERLPRRLIPKIAVNSGLDIVAEIPAKRLEGRGGFEGVLKIGEDRLVFQSESQGGSHTWNLDEVQNISSSDPLELTIASLGTDYRLQLKQPLPEGIYNALWRKLNVRRTHSK
jgi:hypothetical protein